MDLFSVTCHGHGAPFLDSLRPGFVEPLSITYEEKYSLPKVDPEDPKSAALNYPRTMDVYIGAYNGYAYSSHDRMARTKGKGFYRSVGPFDIHRKPMCTSMDYGWNLRDPALEGSSGEWAKTHNRHACVRSEMSNYLDKASRVDKRIIHYNQQS